MKIGIIGTGIVGRTIGAKLIEVGKDVMYGTRDVTKTLARTEPDAYGNPSFSEWKKQHPKAKLGTFQEAASHGEIVINATTGVASLTALTLAGKENLHGKILIDIANPLDFSQEFPPLLAVCNTDSLEDLRKRLHLILRAFQTAKMAFQSHFNPKFGIFEKSFSTIKAFSEKGFRKSSLGEQIQNAFPEVKVVKTLNTVNCYVMVNPELLLGDHNVFVSGNDADAKAQVSRMLIDCFGWKQENLIDLGDITTSRGTEMLLPIWVRLYGAMQHPNFNFHIVVGPKPQM